MLSDRDTQLHECQNCGNQFEGIICNQCAQKVKYFSASPKGLFLEWWAVRKEDLRRFVFTTKEMFLRPATVMNEYMDGKRRKYYNSTNYFLLIASVATFITIQFQEVDPAQAMQNIGEFYKSIGMPIEDDNPGGAMAFEWINKHYNIALMLTLPFLVIATFLINKWFFKSTRYTFGEHFVMNLFMYGFNNLLLLPTLPFINHGDFGSIFFFVNMVILCLLYAWFQKDLYKIGWLKAIFMGILFMVFYYLIFILAIIVITIVVVLVVLGVMLVVKTIT